MLQKHVKSAYSVICTKRVAEGKPPCIVLLSGASAQSDFAQLEHLEDGGDQWRLVKSEIRDFLKTSCFMWEVI